MNDAKRATHFCYGKWSQSRSQRSFLRRFPRAAPIFLPQLWLWAIDGTFAGKREESVAFVRIKSSSSLNFTFIRILNPLLKTDLLITLSQHAKRQRPHQLPLLPLPPPPRAPRLPTRTPPTRPCTLATWNRVPRKLNCTSYFPPSVQLSPFACAEI